MQNRRLQWPWTDSQTHVPVTPCCIREQCKKCSLCHTTASTLYMKRPYGVAITLLIQSHKALFLLSFITRQLVSTPRMGRHLIHEHECTQKLIIIIREVYRVSQEEGTKLRESGLSSYTRTWMHTETNYHNSWSIQGVPRGRDKTSGEWVIILYKKMNAHRN